MALAKVIRKKNITPLHKKHCAVCDVPSQKMYCSNAHKQKAYRIRRKTKLQTVTSNEDHVTSNALLVEQRTTNDLLRQLLAAGISQNVAPSTKTAHHDTPQTTLNDLPELESKRAKTNGSNSRQRLLDSMSAMSGVKKISIKPEAKNNIIKGSDVPLSEPDFGELQL